MFSLLLKKNLIFQMSSRALIVFQQPRFLLYLFIDALFWIA